MNNKFLNKVADRLVKETRIDFTKGKLYAPFYLLHFPKFGSPCNIPLCSFINNPFFIHSFKEHCKEVYGLNNNEEFNYMWNEYGNIIKAKMNNKELV